jgi:ABC-type dipeptide/oligopeptide/nickel transport system permease subunit
MRIMPTASGSDAGQMVTGGAPSAGALPSMGSAISPKGRPGVLRRLAQNRLAVAMVVVVVAYVLIAILAPWISPYDPARMHYRDRLQAPSRAYLLGTDESGRDLLSRIVHGTRVTVLVGFGAATIALTAGVMLGLAAGYRGGSLDHFVMRVLDGLLAFPSVILAMTLVAVFGPSPRNLMVAIGILLTPSMARIVRGTVLAEREKDYVQAAVVAGATGSYISLRVILPNCLSSIIVQGSLSAAAAIKVEAFLSFLGLGTNIPDASWGLLLANGYQYLNRAWWYSLFPALNIFLIVLALNVVGDGLRDALEPRLGRRLPSAPA